MKSVLSFYRVTAWVLRKGQGRGSCICLKARGAWADEFLKAWLSVIPIPYVRSQAIQNMYWGGWCCCTFTLFDVQPLWVFNTELALHIYLLSHVRHEEFFINYRGGGGRREWRASASYNSAFHCFNMFFVLFCFTCYELVTGCMVWVWNVPQSFMIDQLIPSS